MILCIETATTNCSVAIFKGAECVGLKEDSSSGYSHNEQLHVFIQEACAQAGVKLEDLKAVAVSKGPGSYTGLRIGVSAAKGLCYALSIPLIVIETLAVLAEPALGLSDIIIPMIDARRMEVYSSVLDRQGRSLSPAQAVILTKDAFAHYLEQTKVTFIGSGVEKWQTLCTHVNADFKSGVLPSARHMGRLANELFVNKDFADVAYFEPYYLKDFLAYINSAKS